MIEQRLVFHFEAAHELGSNVGDPSHDYAHIHGHSFMTTLILRGEPDPETGWLIDFAQVRAESERIRGVLDHRLLNAIEGIGKPTLENLGRYIFDLAKDALPPLAAVEVARPSLGEAVRFEPSA
ncbi:MAG: 6-carboxytetrahydropterin synthase [Pseudomonadota bacterium]